MCDQHDVGVVAECVSVWVGRGKKHWERNKLIATVQEDATGVQSREVQQVVVQRYQVGDVGGCLLDWTLCNSGIPLKMSQSLT